ncbi:hypothetical protein [Bradyrhizobium diversitatis]|uniref:hypothetical protein n=1 Tax=Bradyrhizobium diversitatis TaxID=2755406 RepID=UPI001FE50337|nr:hypothetical protein [Bradyrhizobium diversitatis]
MADEMSRKRVPIPSDRVRDPFEKLIPGPWGCAAIPSARRCAGTTVPTVTSGDPWLPLERPDGAANVAAQQRDARSMLAVSRADVAAARACVPAPWRVRAAARAERDSLLERTDGSSQILVALNIAAEPRQRHRQGRDRLSMSTHLDRPSEPLLDAAILLRGNEGVIVAIEAR